MPDTIKSSDQIHRFPFIASDILTSSVKLAEALVPLLPQPDEQTSEKEEHGGNSDSEVDTEAKAIQKVLEKTNDSKDKKTTFVDDLEEDLANMDDDFEANMKLLEEENGSAPKTDRNSFTDKKDDDDDEVNVEEDDEEHGKNTLPAQPKISVKISSAGKPLDEDLNLDSYDFTLLDELFGILDLPVS